MLLRRRLGLINARQLHHAVFHQQLRFMLRLFLELAELLAAHLALLAVVERGASIGVGLDLPVGGAFLLTGGEERVRVLTIEPKVGIDKVI